MREAVLLDPALPPYALPPKPCSFNGLRALRVWICRPDTNNGNDKVFS